MRISAVLIVRNEEACLARCLESVRPVVDEIVVADTGSEDRSRAIAQASGARVVEFAWIDDFAAARNFALGKAEGDYILSIDADEYILEPDSARRRLDAFMKSHGPGVVGTVVLRSLMSVNGNEAEFAAERFFRRGAFHYAGAIHEQLLPETGHKRVAPTGVRLYHTGYAQMPDAPDHKSIRNIQILQRELQRQPDDEFLRYQLGKAHFAIEKWADAAWALGEALALVRIDNNKAMGRLGELGGSVFADMVVSLAYARVNTGDLEGAAACLEAYAEVPALFCSPDYHHALGYVRLMAGQLEQARAAYRRALELGREGEMVVGTGSFITHYQLALIAEAQGEVAGAFDEYRACLAERPDYAPTLERCVDIILEHRRPMPRDLWMAADRTALTAAFARRIRALRQKGDDAGAMLLLEGTRLLDPELHRVCAQA